LSADANKDMTYGEFVQRRASIQSEIHAAELMYKKVTDTRYTPMSADGVRLAIQALDDKRKKLIQLVADWQHIQRSRGVKS
jgi:hypothetical protein